MELSELMNKPIAQMDPTTRMSLSLGDLSIIEQYENEMNNPWHSSHYNNFLLIILITSNINLALTILRKDLQK